MQAVFVLMFLALMFAGGAATAAGFYVTARWLQRSPRGGGSPYVDAPSRLPILRR